MFDFIKILTQIINKMKFFDEMKNNLIYAKMIKVLQYIVILMKMTQCFILPSNFHNSQASSPPPHKDRIHLY
jgi:hypothetical protein